MTGPGNRLAHAAAREMAQSAGAAFNPLVIHGGVGLGKTHLLEAIGHALRRSHPGLNIVQLTAEAFTNSFLEAMRTGTLSSFRVAVPGRRRADRGRRPLPGREAGHPGRVPPHVQRPDRQRGADRPGDATSIPG